MHLARVLLTDHPWADVDVERAVIEAAGHELVIGPTEAADSSVIEGLVAESDPSAIITCWARVSAKAVTSPTDLKVVARMGVGLDNIDVQVATERGAWVTNVPDYCVAEVSDHAVALMLSAVRGIAPLDRAVKARGWHVPDYVPPRLSEMVVAIIGYGRIGQATAAKLRAFGCKILVHSTRPIEATDGLESATIAQIHARADVIILHVPLTASTGNMIDRTFIASCARRPLIVNASRGGLIDNAALIWGLDQGLLRGAALDVVDGEPAPPVEVISRPDVIATPHIAYLSDASLIELRRRACEEVVRVLAGREPLNPCNEPSSRVDNEKLVGGVSSDIRLVEGANGPEVVKIALPKLKVAADWYSDPARSAVEVRALRVARELLGDGAVPDVLWVRPDEHSFAMSMIDPRFQNWKQELLAGHVELDSALAAGRMLGRLHSASATRADLAVDFDDRSFFQELRIDPFFESVAIKLPHLAGSIRAVAAAMMERRIALVHGDFSPKNILADKSDVVILDFEVTHWGDPRFDIGFCLSHLLLKAARTNADSSHLYAAATTFLDGYAETGLAGLEDADLGRITACLMLARTDGVSPVDYLDEGSTTMARASAEELLRSSDADVRSHIVHVSGVRPS